MPSAVTLAYMLFMKMNHAGQLEMTLACMLYIYIYQ